MIIILQKKATKAEIEKAKEEFRDFIKIVVDIEKEIAAIGGKLHADAEKLLLEKGSKNKNLWGGGFDLKNNAVDTQAMINIRPTENDNMEILDQEIRERFLKIAKKLLLG